MQQLMMSVTMMLLGATIVASHAAPPQGTRQAPPHSPAQGATQSATQSPAATPAPAVPAAPARDEAPHPSVELPPELARVLTDYEQAWSARDAAGLARLFAEDGWVLARGNPPQRGRAAIQRHYTGQGGPLSLRALAFQTDGRVGYIIGGYASAKGEPDMGKFTLTLRKDADGRWLIVSDMDNDNSRPRR